MSGIDQLQTILSGIIPTLTDSTLQSLNSAFSEHHYTRAQPLLSQGMIWNKVYIIDTGLIRMHFLRRDGKEFNKNFFSEKTLIYPLTPTMQTEPSLFGISCIEDCKIWQCDVTVFIDLLPEDTQQKLQSQLLIRLLDSKLQREHDLLALSAMQRYQKFLATHAALSERIPLNHLATYLGMTDVSLSRLRRQLK